MDLVLLLSRRPRDAVAFYAVHNPFDAFVDAVPESERERDTRNTFLSSARQRARSAYYNYTIRLIQFVHGSSESAL